MRRTQVDAHRKFKESQVKIANRRLLVVRVSKIFTINEPITVTVFTLIPKQSESEEISKISASEEIKPD